MLPRPLITSCATRSDCRATMPVAAAATRAANDECPPPAVYFSRRLLRISSGKAGCSYLYTGSCQQILPRPLLRSHVACSARRPAKLVVDAATRAAIGNWFPVCRLLLSPLAPLAVRKSVCSCRYACVNDKCSPVRCLVLAPLTPIAVWQAGCTCHYTGGSRQIFPHPPFTSRAVRSDCHAAKSLQLLLHVRWTTNIFPFGVN